MISQHRSSPEETNLGGRRGKSGMGGLVLLEYDRTSGLVDVV